MWQSACHCGLCMWGQYTETSRIHVARSLSRWGRHVPRAWWYRFVCPSQVPVIAALEQRMLSLLKRRADELMERRRQDVRDQAEELAPSMAVSQYLGPWARVGTKLYEGCRGLNIIEKAQFIALFGCHSTALHSRGSSSHLHHVSL
jgi:hypothetical protein